MKTVQEIQNFEEMKNTVIFGDSLELLKKIPDNSVDLVLTDPPYILSDTGSKKKSCIKNLHKYNKTGFKKLIAGFDIEAFFSEFLRVSKKMNMFCFCSNKQVSSIMSWGEEKGFYTTLLVWNKTNSPPFANGVWRGDTEFCVHIRSKGAYFEGNAEIKKKVIQMPTNPSEFGHPTEKPLELIERYLIIGSSENAIVLDPFGGSFTTARACKNLKRNFISCDIEEKYCKIGDRRLAQENLF